MPTFDKRARYPGNQSRIAIPTLSGGVGRQAPTKRSINEAQNLDNVLVTLERSVEKRPPTNFIQRFSNADLTTLDASLTDSRLSLANSTVTADYGFFWFQISEQQRYLIAIDYSSTSASDDYLQIFKVTKDGFYECTIDGTDEADNHAYFTYGNATSSFRESLSSISVGPQLLINNNKVFTGYTSVDKTWTSADVSNGVKLDNVAVTSAMVGKTNWVKPGFDGKLLGATDTPPNYKEDIKGRKIVYYTGTPVDPEGQASVYVNGQFYIKNNQVFSSIANGTDLKDWLKKRYNQTGTLEFATVTHPSGNQNQAYKFETLPEDIPLDLITFKVKAIKLENNEFNPGNGSLDPYIKLTFDTLEGRTKFLELDKFYIGDTGLNIDVSLAQVTISNDSSGYYITWTSQGSDDDSVDEILDFAKTAAASAIPTKLSFKIKGIVQDFTLPTDLQTLVTNYGAGDYTLNLAPNLEDNANIVLIFTCIQEGTAEDADHPAFNTEAGSSAASFTLRSTNDGGSIAKYISVEDWKYPDATRRYLGNKLSDFSEFKFPPKDGESNTDNDGAKGVATGSSVDDFLTLNAPPVDMDGKIEATLTSLYTNIDAQGDGKIYYVENSYAGEVPGFYIIKDEDNSPYTRLIRTPYEYSVLDETRFPKVLKIKNFDSNNKEVFSIIDLNLEERRSGNITTNPGPEAFKEGSQKRIQSMAFFRDRLFLSAADTVFSSRTGDFSDFWVVNPSTIADTDPIDIRLSTNKYAEVESMTPFSSNMFINTASDIQFTLQGSENNITPFTAEISPTAFYSTSPLVDPVLLGSQIYFFAPNRAYIYFNSNNVSINQALEVSLSCPQYLPTNFGDTAVVPGYDSLCMIDNDNKKFLYMYTNRYRGAEVAQNAFYRYIYDTDIATVNSYDNDIYFVTRHFYPNEANDKYEYYLEYQKFYEDDLAVPRLDHQIKIKETDAASFGSVTYNSTTDKTTIVINKYGNPKPDYLYIAEGAQAEERSGEALILDATNTVISNGTVTITLPGDYTTALNYRQFIVGTSYTMNIELSPQYVRDPDQNVVEGVYSIRTLHLQHHNTGTYYIEKKVRGRKERVLTYTPSELDEESVISVGGSPIFTGDPDDLPMPLYEKQGETFSKILGFAAETDIFIISDTPNPVNIAQIELKGRFTNRTSGFVR